MMSDEYKDHLLQYMVIGNVDWVATYGDVRTVQLINCISTPGPGVGYKLNPDWQWRFELIPDVDTPAVGDRIAVRTPERVYDGHYRKCWWYPVTY